MGHVTSVNGGSTKGPGLESVSGLQQGHGMRRKVHRLRKIRDMHCGHWTVTGKVLRCPSFNLLYHGSRNFKRFGAGLFFDGIGSVVTRAPFDGMDLGVHDKVEDVACFVSYFLNAQMTGDLVTDVPECIGEIKFEPSLLVAEVQIFKGVKKSVLHF